MLKKLKNILLNEKHMRDYSSSCVSCPPELKHRLALHKQMYTVIERQAGNAGPQWLTIQELL